jgi:hypothetical protein
MLKGWMLLHFFSSAGDSSRGGRGGTDGINGGGKWSKTDASGVGVGREI